MGFFWVSEPEGGQKYSRSCDETWHVFCTSLPYHIGLWRVDYDVSWCHNDVTKQPFWILSRHLDSRACNHTVDKLWRHRKLYEFVLRNILNQNKHKKVKDYLLLKNEGEKNWMKDWKKTENGQNTSWVDGCYETSIIIDTSLTLENFLWKISGKVTRFGDNSSSCLKVIIR